MLVGAAVGVGDGIVVKLLGQEVHPFEIVFFRNLFSMLTLMLLLRGSDWSLRAGGLWPLHIARASLKLLALAASFVAISRLPLATVTAIAFTAPIFTVLGALLFLREAARIPRLIALALSFVGVLIVARPVGADQLDWGLFAALGSAIALAAVMLLLKVSSERESGKRVVWLNLAFSVPVSLLICLPFWTTPSPTALAIMAVQGIGGLAAQMAITRAMRLGEASMLVVVDFVRLPLAAGVGVLLFSESISPALLVGGALILAALLLVASDRQFKTVPGAAVLAMPGKPRIR